MNILESISIGTVQFAINAENDAHLVSEHPLGSISRLIAELLSQRLTFLGLSSDPAKLIVSKPEENTHKQLIYTSMLPLETVRKILENRYFDYCLYGEINFENGLKIEISLLDSQENKNLWRREINSKTYDLSVIIRRIIEETGKILMLDYDLDKIKGLEKFSSTNLRAWGWYALAFEDELELFDKETALLKALETDPDFLEAKLKLISLQLGSETSVEAAMKSLSEIKDNLSTEILNYFGLQMFIHGKYSEAGVFYQLFLEKSASALRLRSVSDTVPERSRRDLEELSDILLKLIKINFELQESTKFNLYINEYLEITPENNIDFEQLPYFLFMSGNQELSLNLAKKGVVMHPGSAKIYSVLGFIYAGLNNFSDAAKAYEKSFLLAFNPSILEDWSAALLKLNENDRIINIIEKYQDDLPYNSGIECNLAIAYLNKGETERAIKILEKSVKKDKDNARSNALLGNLYFKNKSYARAQKYLLIASKLEPVNFYWYKALGDLFYDSGDSTEAVKYYNKATELEPQLKISRYLCYEADLLKQDGNYDEAIAKYKLAVRAEPGLVVPYNNSGMLCYEIGDYDSAAAYFEKAIKLEPENPELWLNLSKVYEIKSKGFFKKKWKVKYQEAANRYKDLTTNDTN
jgi:tetratricopeptide (TPR) repeat protein